MAVQGAAGQNIGPEVHILLNRGKREILQSRFNDARILKKTLQYKTQMLILKNKQFFTELSIQHPERNPLDKISNTMKNELIELMSAEDEDGCELVFLMLRLLVNTKIETFKFPRGFLRPEYRAATTALWQRLAAEQLPDLHTLIAKEGPNSTDKWNFSLLFKATVPSFPNLVVLKLGGFECKDLHLSMIARKLTKLRVLDTSLCSKFVTKRGFKALVALESLQELTIDSSYWSEHYDHRPFKWCYELLPKLHVAGFKATPNTLRKLLYELGLMSSEALSTAKNLQPLQLQQLILKFHYPFYVPHIEFSEVRELICLHENIDDLVALDLDHFPKLTDLSLLTISEQQQLAILARVGQQLRSLQSDISHSWVRLDQVLSLCPNLTQLRVKAFGLVSSGPGVVEPNPLQNLRELHISTTITHLRWQHGLAPFLQPLNLAPNLRSLHLSMRMADGGEVAALVSLAEQRTCMQHLEELRVIVFNDNVSEFHKFWLEFKLLSCVDFCEKLHTVEFNVKSEQEFEDMYAI